MITYSPMLMGLGYAALGGAVLFLLVGVFVFMEKTFQRYLRFRGYSEDQIESNLPELKEKHDGSWYWFRAGIVVVPLLVWLVINYYQLFTGI